MGILGELWVKLGLKNNDFKKGLQDSQKTASGFMSKLKGIGTAIGGVFAVKKIYEWTKALTAAANQAEGVKRAFKEIATPNLLNNLRKATQGTVSDFQLMQKAVQAKNFNIPLENLATYLEFATKRARETGQSVDYLVDSIITGLGRQSVMILDNLGLSAAEIRDKMKDGGTMADAVGEIIKNSMGGAEGATQLAGVATDNLAASWENLKVTIGGSMTGIRQTIERELAQIVSTANQILSAENFTRWEKLGMFLGGWNSKRNYTKLLAQNSQNAAIEQGAAEDAKKQIEAIKSLAEAQRELMILEQDAAKSKGKPEDDYTVLRIKYAKQYLLEYIDAETKRQAELKKQEEEARKQAAEKAKRRNSLILSLEDEIKKKTEIRDLSGSTTEVDKLNAEIQKLEEKLKLLRMTKEEREEYEKNRITNRNAKTPQLEGLFDLNALQENTNRGVEIMEQGLEAWKQKGAGMVDVALQQQAMVNEAANMLAQGLANGVSSSLNELANVIAGVEGANIGTVVQALLSPLADACISAGLLIMTTGEGIEALRTSLTTFLGVGAIAAGAALMAVGMAAKAGLAAIGKGGGRSAATSVPTTSYTGGYGVNTNNYQQNEFALTTTLKGQDLLLSIERTQQNNKR